MRINESLTRRTIRSRLVTISLGGVWVSALILGLFAALTLWYVEITAERNTLSMSLQAAANDLNATMGSASRTASGVAKNEYVVDSLSDDNLTGDAKLTAEISCMGFLQQMSDLIYDIDSVSVIGENGLMTNSNGLDFKYESFTSNSWYQAVYLSESVHWFDSREGSYAVKSPAGIRYLSFAMRIRPQDRVDPLGVVLVDIRESAILSTMRRHMMDNSQFFLSDAGGSLICETVPSGMTSPLTWDTARDLARSAVEDTENLSPTQYIRTARLNNGWLLVQVLHSQVLKNSGFLFGILFLAFLVAALVVSLLINKYSADVLIRRLQILSERAALVEAGDLTIRMDESGQDEISALAHGLNAMIEELGTLLTTVYDDQHDLRRAELAALQAQINPHFLYNTLDSITWLIRFQRYVDAEKMLIALTKFYRLGLNKGKDIIPISEELEHANSYLLIQNVRYHDAFRVTWDIEPGLQPRLKNTFTPKLILQPIIENAIYHGINAGPKSGNIRIRLYSQDENLFFEITDDGVGMSESQLSQLRLGLENGRTFGEGFGLCNVNSRIRVFFGHQYGIFAESTPGRGTRITIHLPFMQEEL